MRSASASIEGLRQAFRALEDFCLLQYRRRDVDHEISETLINQELRDAIEYDVQLAVDEVADFFEFWGDGEGEEPEVGRCGDGRVFHRDRPGPGDVRSRGLGRPESRTGHREGEAATAAREVSRSLRTRGAGPARPPVTGPGPPRHDRPHPIRVPDRVRPVTTSAHDLRDLPLARGRPPITKIGGPV